MPEQIAGVYKKFKHMETLFHDCQFSDDPFRKALFECWAAIENDMDFSQGCRDESNKKSINCKRDPNHEKCLAYCDNEITCCEVYKEDCCMCLRAHKMCVFGLTGQECRVDIFDTLTKRDYEQIAKDLWMLLDDIDTLTDMMKPDKTPFYHAVYGIVQRRHEYPLFKEEAKSSNSK